MDSDSYKQLTAFLTDPTNGASIEKNAEMKEYMARPEVALAMYQSLMKRDLSDFNPNDIHLLPPKTMELLHKHFPADIAWCSRGTQICTIEPNGGKFSLKGRPMDDARVLSLQDVGQESLTVFVKNSVQFVDSHIHRKMHAVFLKAEDRCTKIDLCDFFEWCKCSVLSDRLGDSPDEMSVVFIETPFGRVFLTVQVLQNADECKVEFLEGNKTVQIQIKHNKGFRAKIKGPIKIGVGLHTANYCRRCKKPSSDTVKLKECSRCLTYEIKLFYCSRECQLLDYADHRRVCTYNWIRSDWRENAPDLVK
jgi:hypothetical protein